MNWDWEISDAAAALADDLEADGIPHGVVARELREKIGRNRPEVEHEIRRRRPPASARPLFGGGTPMGPRENGGWVEI